MLFLQIASVIAQDTIRQPKVVVAMDSVPADSLIKKKPKKSPLEATVDYEANDSLRFEIKGQKVFLFKTAKIKYQEITLNADYVEINFVKNAVYATGAKDSLGRDVGIPEFNDGSQNFKSKKRLST